MARKPGPNATTRIQDNENQSADAPVGTRTASREVVLQHDPVLEDILRRRLRDEPDEPNWVQLNKAK